MARQPAYAFGDVLLDPGGFRVLRRGEPLELEPKAVGVLLDLVRHAGELRERDTLLDVVWGHAHITPSVLSRIISQLRQALGDSPAHPHYIETVHTRGYRFIGAVEQRLVDSEAATAGTFAAPGLARLPTPPGPLIGRESELAELDACIAAARLNTLIGTGGMGKTRLAIEAARRSVARYDDGVRFIDLSPYHVPEAIVCAVAAAFDVPESPREPLAPRLTALLAARRLLLVLDNCDRIAEPVGALVAELLAACPDLAVLATSQVPLRIRDERLYRVPPLALPMTDWWDRADALTALAEVASVRLLVMRVQTALPTFGLTETNAPTIVELCRHLDGVPLALELAAARLRLLSPEQMLMRLKDRFAVLAEPDSPRPPRQRTLGAVLEWSFGLLDEREQALLSGLSVFAGEWALGGAEAVGAALRLEPEWVLDLLGRLVDKSLVSVDLTRNPPRYRLLESVREFARLRLAARGEVELVQRAHLDHCIELTALADSELRGPRQGLWLERLSQEQTNLANAFELACRHPELHGQALDLATHLRWYWRARGDFVQSHEWLRTALAQVPHTGGTVVRALVGLGWALEQRDENEAALAVLDEAVIQAAVDLDCERSTALSVRAVVHARLAHAVDARADADRACALADACGDPWLRSLALLSRGMLLALAGEPVAAIRELELAVAIEERAEGDRSHLALLLQLLSVQQSAAGDSRAGARTRVRCVDVAMKLGNRPVLAGCVEGCAHLLAQSRQWLPAARLFGAAAAVREATAAPMSRFWSGAQEQAISAVRSALGDGFDAAFAAGRRARFEDVAAEARAWLVRFATPSAPQTALPQSPKTPRRPKTSA